MVIIPGPNFRLSVLATAPTTSPSSSTVSAGIQPPTITAPTPATAPACPTGGGSAEGGEKSGSKFSFREDFRRSFVGSPPPTSPLSPTSSGNMSFLSVAPLSPPILRSELGGVVKAHTDNLDRYIAEIEATEATGSLPTMPAKKQPKLPYIRRRYTGTAYKAK